MRPLVNAFLKDSRFHTLIVIFILGLAIWNFGPLFSFGHSHPLASHSHRLAALLALAILWGVTNLFPELKQVAIPGFLNRIDTEVKLLRSHLKMALARSNSNWFKRWLHLPQSSWYLVIGGQNSGKTSLLEAGKTESKLSDQPPAITNTHQCDYWFMNNAVFMELSSRFVDSEYVDNYSPTLFNQFVKLCKRQRVPLQGIIITIPLPELMQQQEQLKTECQSILQLMQQLKLEMPQCPITIVVTKCDRIAGFKEFFAELNTQDRQLSCGVEFGKPPYAKSLPDLFNEKFTQFLHQLNQRVLWRMHQEHGQEARQLIKDFPNELELLKSTLAQSLNVLLPTTEVALEGIYFTSSKTKHATINNLIPAMEQAFSLPTHLHASEAPQDKTYFVRELFEKWFTQHKDNVFTTKDIVINTTLAIVITSTIASVGYQYYRGHFSDFNYATTVLNKASNYTDTQVLEKLQALEATLVSLQHENKAKIANEHSLSEKTYSGMWTILQTQFLPELLTMVENEISHNLNAEPYNINTTVLYDTLKTYLMMTQPKHFDKDQVSDWFDRFWQRTIADKGQRNQLQRYLRILLSKPLPAHPENVILVQQARKELRKISPEQLALTMVNNATGQQKMMLVNNYTQLIIDPRFNEVPTIYTQIMYNEVYNKQIPEAADKIANGNWILGSETQAIDINRLVTQTQARYLENYANYWQNTVDHVKKSNLEHFNDYVDQLTILSSQQSPLIELIDSISENTRAIQDETEFNRVVSDKFRAIQAVKAHQTEIASALAKLSEQLNTVANDAQPVSAAYQLVKTRMQDPKKLDPINEVMQLASQMPEPVGSYLTEVTKNGWRLMLRGAATYLNTIWTQFVVPEYDGHVRNKYPFYSESHQDVSLDDFAHFFAPNGVLDTFLQNYLMQFIEQTASGWQWKAVNGETITFTTATFEPFIRGVLIQRMFFHGNGTHPALAFSITPKSINPDIKEFNLIMDGQEVPYTNGQSQTIAVSWPGPQKDGVKLSYTTATSKTTNMSFEGTWAWFRLLEKSNKQEHKDNHKVDVSFDFDGHAIAVYELEADGAINPFTPDILNHFRVPERLS